MQASWDLILLNTYGIETLTWKKYLHILILFYVITF